MEVYFIRHGKTEWNARGVFQGRTDIRLSDVGREQAREAGEQIRSLGISFDQVICSPLVRARETAALVSGYPDHSIMIDDRLTEMAFGVLEGTDFYTPSYPGCESASKPFGGLFVDPEHFEAPEGCETFQELKARTGAFLEDLFRRSASPDAPRNVLVVSHGGVIRSILLVLREVPLAEMWGIKVPNCRFFPFTFSGETAAEHPDPLGGSGDEAWT
ncbi:MAG: histidine phosphatase family protein [Lachnospiraceae bacterium]|nr:histidine phosphatase family protein [Lachnospiraceae bacterium]